MKKNHIKKSNKILKGGKKIRKSKTKKNKKSKKYSVYKKIVGGMNPGGLESNSDNNNKTKAKRLSIQITGDLNTVISVLSTDQIYESIQKEVGKGNKIKIFFGEDEIIIGDTFQDLDIDDGARLIVQFDYCTFNDIVKELVELNPWVDETKLRDSNYFPLNKKWERTMGGLDFLIVKVVVLDIQFLLF